MRHEKRSHRITQTGEQPTITRWNAGCFKYECCACLRMVCVADAVAEECVGIRNGTHAVAHYWYTVEACVGICNGTHS